MKIRLTGIITVFALQIGICPYLQGQQERSALEISLEKIFTRIINTRNDRERLRLNDSVRLLVDAHASSDSVMNYNFIRLRYPGQVNSPDGNIKIITWNLVLSDGSDSYFLYLIRRGKKGESNRVYKLTGHHRQTPPDKDSIYTEKNWYGALYYGIRPFKVHKKVFYVLLGIDQGEHTSRKIIDFLSFGTGDSILFGRKCLEKDNKLYSRAIMEYSSEGIVTLRFDRKNVIVFDHIVPYTTGHRNNPDNYGAGLYFDGYAYKKGIWKFVSNINVKNSK